MKFLYFCLTLLSGSAFGMAKAKKICKQCENPSCVSKHQLYDSTGHMAKNIRVHVLEIAARFTEEKNNRKKICNDNEEQDNII